MSKSFRLDGVDKTKFLEFWDLDVPPQQVERFRNTRNGMLVGRRVYDVYRWPLGTTVRIGVLNDVAAVVCGVYDSGGTALDSRALVGRRFAQEAMNKQGIANNILVKVDRAENAGEVITAIDEGMTLSKKTETKSEASLLAELGRELEDMRATSRIIALVALAAVFFGIWNTISMATRDRTQEFGILRTLGFTRPHIASFVLMEGGVLAGLGGLFAVPVVMGAMAIFQAVQGGELQFMGVVIAVKADPVLLALSTPTAMLVGLLGALLPAWLASSKPVVDALRSVE